MTPPETVLALGWLASLLTVLLLEHERAALERAS